MSVQTFTVDANGDIRVHKRGGIVLPLSMRDAAGVAIDVSGRSQVFEIKGLLSKAAVANPANALGLRIVLTKADIDKLPVGSPVDFALIDKSGEVPDVLWSGQITGVGW